MSVSPPGSRIPYLADNQALWKELQPRPWIAIPVSLGPGTKVLVDGACAFGGWAFRETSANAGSFDFYDGRDATGEQVGSQVIASSGGNSQAISSEGLLLEVGLTIVVTTSTLKGAVWVTV